MFLFEGATIILFWEKYKFFAHKSTFFFKKFAYIKKKQYLCTRFTIMVGCPSG